MHLSISSAYYFEYYPYINRKEVAKILLDRRAYPYFGTKRGDTCIDYCSSPDIMKMLISVKDNCYIDKLPGIYLFKISIHSVDYKMRCRENLLYLLSISSFSSLLLSVLCYPLSYSIFGFCR